MPVFENCREEVNSPSSVYVLVRSAWCQFGGQGEKKRREEKVKGRKEKGERRPRKKERFSNSHGFRQVVLSLLSPPAVMGAAFALENGIEGRPMHQD
jgi:hypothetical protein